MSKTSSKKRYTQLMSWLETYKPSPKAKKNQPKKVNDVQIRTHHKKHKGKQV